MRGGRHGASPPRNPPIGDVRVWFRFDGEEAYAEALRMLGVLRASEARQIRLVQSVGNADVFQVSGLMQGELDSIDCRPPDVWAADVMDELRGREAGAEET